MPFSALASNRRILACILLVFVASCAPGGDSKDELLDLATQLRADGDTDAAIAKIREAIRNDPSDPQLRLFLAESYLDQEKGQLALTALDQATDRGLPALRALLPQTRALFIEQRFGEIIAAGIPDGLSPDDEVFLLDLKAKSHARRTGRTDGFDDGTVRAYQALFRLMDEAPESAAMIGMKKKLQQARVSQPVIARAWQHYSCDRDESKVTTGWEPLPASEGRTIRVGAGRDFETIGEAASAARDGDTVELDPGLYVGGVAHWPQNRLLVRGVDNRPVITAAGRSIEERDVWLFTGDDVTIENVEIYGARSRWKNGAGIRHVGNGLTIRHVYLHDNENGLLTGNSFPDTNEVLIEFSEFSRNGDGRGEAHNIYVGRASRLELRYSFSHQSLGGHLVKSRARENLIAYNRLTDGADGQSSYIADIAEGGTAVLVGNVIEQGVATLNHGMISFAAEGQNDSSNSLKIVNNSIYNRSFEAVLVRNHRDLDVVLMNNLIGGAPATSSDRIIEQASNIMRPDHGMADPRNYDFGLVTGSQAIDRGASYDTRPDREYVHPLRWRPRASVWRIDIGAYERCGI